LPVADSLPPWVTGGSEVAAMTRKPEGYGGADDDTGPHSLYRW
jgi:hypothetical protein